jgi:hypothetical protein
MVWAFVFRKHLQYVPICSTGYLLKFNKLHFATFPSYKVYFYINKKLGF